MNDIELVSDTSRDKENLLEGACISKPLMNTKAILSDKLELNEVPVRV